MLNKLHNFHKIIIIKYFFIKSDAKIIYIRSYKLYYLRRGQSMEKQERLLKKDFIDEDIGFLLWQLEGIENFYPCYKTMIRKEER